MSDDDYDTGNGNGGYLAHLRKQYKGTDGSEALSNRADQIDGDEGGLSVGAQEALSKLPSSVLELRCMELLKKNRELNVRVESEKARNLKLQNRVVAMEKEKMEEQRKNEVLLPSERRAQQQQSLAANGKVGTKKTKDGGVELDGPEAMLADAENQIQQLQAQVASGNKALALFRKQNDESKKEMAKLKKILLKELGDEAIYLTAIRVTDAAEGGGNSPSEGLSEAFDDTSSQRTGTTMVGGARPSLTQLVASTRGGGGNAPNATNVGWKGRAEQIQILKGKVRTLEKQLRESQKGGRGDVSEGVSEVEGNTAEVVSLANAGPRAGNLLQNAGSMNPNEPLSNNPPRTSGIRSNSSASPSSFAGVRTNFDDLHEHKLKQQGALKRQEAEQTKRDLETNQALLAKERQKSESLSLRLKHLETEQHSAKASLQALFTKAGNDDNLILSYKTQMEEVRQENKNLMKQLQRQSNGDLGGTISGSPTTSASQFTGLKKKDLLALGDPEAVANKANIARQYGKLLGQGGSPRDNNNNDSNGEVFAVRLRLTAAEEERDALRLQLLNLQRIYEASKQDEKTASATKATKNGPTASKKRQASDDDSDEDADRRPSKAGTKSQGNGRQSSATPAVVAGSSEGSIEQISQQVARRYAWLLHSAEANEAAQFASNSSSMPYGESPSKQGARQAIEIASDLIGQQRQAILSYEKQLQKMGTASAPNISKSNGSADSSDAREIQMLRQENFHLKDRIKSVTAMMNREIEMHKQTASAMLQMSASQSAQLQKQQLRLSPETSGVINNNNNGSVLYSAPSIASTTRPPSSATATNASKDFALSRRLNIRSDEDMPARDDDEEVKIGGAKGFTSKNNQARLFTQRSEEGGLQSTSVASSLMTSNRGGSAGSFLPAISSNNANASGQRAATAETLPTLNASRGTAAIKVSAFTSPIDIAAEVQIRQEYQELKKAFNTLQLQVMRQQQPQSPTRQNDASRVPTPPVAPQTHSTRVGPAAVAAKSTTTTESNDAKKKSNGPTTSKVAVGKVTKSKSVKQEADNEDDQPLSNLPTPRTQNAATAQLVVPKSLAAVNSIAKGQQEPPPKPVYRVVGDENGNDNQNDQHNDSDFAPAKSYLNSSSAAKNNNKLGRDNASDDSDTTASTVTATRPSKIAAGKKPAVPRQRSVIEKEVQQSASNLYSEDFYVKTSGPKPVANKPFSVRDEKGMVAGHLPPQRRVAPTTFTVKSPAAHHVVVDEDGDDEEVGGQFNQPIYNPNVMLRSQTKAPTFTQSTAEDEPIQTSTPPTVPYTFGGREPATSTLPTNMNGGGRGRGAGGYASRLTSKQQSASNSQPRARF